MSAQSDGDDVREQLREQVELALRTLLDAAGDRDALPDFAIEVPRQKQHGDFSCNAAMLLAKRLRKSPREIAEELTRLLGDAEGLIASSAIAGPGFLNFKLAESSWQERLHEILSAADQFGRSQSGPPDGEKKIQVEFVSANPTGPLSTGHGRQAVLGDCIARLLDATGWDVVREYYFNDGGRQMRVLGESVKARYLERLGLAAPPPDAPRADPEQQWIEQVDIQPVVLPPAG